MKILSGNMIIKEGSLQMDQQGKSDFSIAVSLGALACDEEITPFYLYAFLLFPAADQLHICCICRYPVKISSIRHTPSGNDLFEHELTMVFERYTFTFGSGQYWTECFVSDTPLDIEDSEMLYLALYRKQRPLCSLILDITDEKA